LQKILVLRFSSIGDIVLTTPVIRCIKQQLPDVEVHYLTKSQYKGILEHNPYIDFLHVLDKPLWKKAIELKHFGFDCIIDLHNNLRTRIIKGILDVPAYSYNKLNFEKSLLVNFKTNNLPNVHIVKRYLDTTKALGVLDDGKGLDYFLPPTFHFNPNIQLPESFVSFAIGAQHITKRLPNEKIVEICKQYGEHLVLLGGKEDAENGEWITQQSGKHVINLCGKLNLNESAYVVSKSEKVITHDTGMMHIAAAFQKEIISIWGNTVPEFGMTPYYGNKEYLNSNFETIIKDQIRNSKFEIPNLSCRPCSKIGFKRCPMGHFNCMNLQDTKAIADAAKV
jgi:ADP-heptose:LPS heptosyltransferase